MDKSTLKYFWSHFKQLKVENEYLFAYRHGNWSAHKISRKNEYQTEGQLDEDKLNDIAPALVGSQIYIVHNHPTGSPEPSDFDFYHYSYIRALLSGHNLELSDFLILSSMGYFSFKEAGYINSAPLYHSQVAEEGAAIIPYASTVSLEESQHHQLWELAQQYTEFIFHKDKQYVATHDFSPTFLTPLIENIWQKNVFYRRQTNCPNELERLRAIDALLSPIEIYWVTENETIPLKLQGVI
ncbi:hypothetical protein CN918_27450 [Priestia megaterium]|nr:hypothetical protein CN918_27450 [Priestia megaterium]